MVNLVNLTLRHQLPLFLSHSLWKQQEEWKRASLALTGLSFETLEVLAFCEVKVENHKYTHIIIIGRRGIILFVFYLFFFLFNAIIMTKRTNLFLSAKSDKDIPCGLMLACIVNSHILIPSESLHSTTYSTGLKVYYPR